MTSTGGGVSYGRALELKTRDDHWTVEGYPSVFDVVDLGNDIVRRGAFKQSLEAGGRVRFLFSHQPDQIVGKAVEVREDGHGLYFKGQISRTALGADIHTLLADQALDAFSIGYIPRRWETEVKSGARHLHEVDLLEVSLVSMPMLPAARVTGFKAQRAPSPLVAQLEAVIVRLRRKRLIASLSDAELRGYGQMVRWRVEHRAERLAAGGR